MHVVSFFYYFVTLFGSFSRLSSAENSSEDGTNPEKATEVEAAAALDKEAAMNRRRRRVSLQEVLQDELESWEIKVTNRIKLALAF